MCAVAVARSPSSCPIDTSEFLAGFQAGRYRVRFASNASEIAAAQCLRYKTLFLENGGTISAEMARSGLDADELDTSAYHVIVLDNQQSDSPVVGTLRLLSSDRLPPDQCFYTEQAFAIHGLRERYAKILELSRFCIDANGRSGSILMLIWKFTVQFIIAHRFDVMIGCASFHGTNVAHHRAILSYLYRHNLAPGNLQSVPIVDNYISIKSLLRENVDWDEAKRSVPTLLRGYLKVGAKISDCAIIDPIFNTTFVCIYVDAEKMILNDHRLTRPQHG